MEQHKIKITPKLKGDDFMNKKLTHLDALPLNNYRQLPVVEEIERMAIPTKKSKL